MVKTGIMTQQGGTHLLAVSKIAAMAAGLSLQTCLLTIYVCI